VLFDPPPIKTYKTPNLKQYSHALTTKLQDLYSRIQQEGFQQIVSNYWLKALARCCEQLKVPLPLKLRIVKLQAVNMRSLRAYVAQAPYSAPIVMYLPEQGITPQGEIPEGWQTVATGQLTIQSVPGRHHLDGDSAGSFFSEPAVATLASLLNEQLALTA
jgi:hypothetical protein